MRGTPWPSCEDKPHPGIIPAYAGNTTSRAAPCPDAWDHPRVCGEHTGVGAANVTAKGSSPRMRGTRKIAARYEKLTGIIPAYAGNTSNVRSSMVSTWDHPRVCGEHLGCLVGRVDGGGIIPAYAGNTSGMRLAHSHWRDHPRVCGEHKIKNATALAKGDHPRVCGEHYDPARPRQAAAGSSPRMRGTP